MFSTPSNYSSQVAGGLGAREQDFPPLLFSLTPQHEAGPGTPRSVTRTGVPSGSTNQRMSTAGTPNSVHTEATPPPPPPPVMRLTDDVVMGEC